MDYRAEGFHLHGRALQFRMAQPAHLLRPLLAATLIEPHAADVLQETRRTLYPTLVGEVQFIRTVVDDSLPGLNTHQAPRATRQVRKLPVLRRDGSHRRCRVVSCHGYYRHGPQPRHLLHLLRQHTYLRARLYHAAKVPARQSHALQQPLRQVTRARIQHLRCRGNGVLTHRLARQHPTQGIGHEEHLPTVLQGRVASLLHGIQLEQRVEVHELNTRDVVHRLAVCHPVQVLLHPFEGVRVAVGHRIAQQRTVLTHQHKVHPPRVNTDAGDVDTPLAHYLQALDHFEVQRIDVPVEVSARLYQVVRKSRQFLLFQSSVRQRAQDGTSTRSPQVNGKEVLFHNL